AATTRTTRSHTSASARLTVPSASANATPAVVAGTTDSPTSGETRTTRPAHSRTAATSPAGSTAEPGSDGCAATQPPRASTSTAWSGLASAISSANRAGDPPVSSGSHPEGRRARCASLRAVHAAADGSGVAVATYRTSGAEETRDSAYSDLPERIPPSTRTAR